MNLHHVNSKETMLSAEDILLVSVHDHKEIAKKYYEQAGSPQDISPERVFYTVLIKIMSFPFVIRVREGNTLFCFIPMSNDGVATALMFDADVPKNTIRNCVESFNAARKMGFNRLFMQTESPEITKLAQVAFNLGKQPGDTFQNTGTQIVVGFGNV